MPKRAYALSNVGNLGAIESDKIARNDSASRLMFQLRLEKCLEKCLEKVRSIPTESRGLIRPHA